MIEVDVGDQVVMNMNNNLGNETTGIHPHGISQRGTAEMDGVPGVTMCPLQPGAQWTQSFTANPSGTHLFHSHAKGQYPDGLRAPMIVHDPSWEATLDVDAQYLLSVSDWYHMQAPEIVHSVLTTGKTPHADASLMNDSMTATYSMQPGKKYLFRMVSMSAFMAHEITFADHEMVIVAADGQQVKPYSTSSVVLGAAQRYDAIITAKSDASKNYAIFSNMTDSKFSNTGTLQYTSNDPVQGRIPASESGAVLNDLKLVPTDEERLLEPVDQTITYALKLEEINGQKRYVFGDNTYLSQDTPSLYTALTTGENANNPLVYGNATNPSVVQYGQIIQIVVNNLDSFAHPMHLHGHRFQVVARGTGIWNGDDTYFPLVPLKRDTVTTQPNGHLVLRFQADNPGVWSFHCHMEWHLEAGMRSTIVEAPSELQSLITIPPSQLAICREQCMPTKGNCAGDEVNVLDTSRCHNVPTQNDTWGALIYPPQDPSQTASSKRGSPARGPCGYRK